jgi:hypothetical protein
VRSAPVFGWLGRWRTAGGQRPEVEPEFGRARAAPGTYLRRVLRLGPGRWELSLQYLSAVPLELRVDGRVLARLAPQRGENSAYWEAGTFWTKGGPATVEVHVPRRRVLDAERPGLIGSLAAQRIDVAEREVPLRRACGRYVDWYRLAPEPS